MLSKEDNMIYCDVLGCSNKTIPNYPYGIFVGWKWINGLGYYVCPECRRKAEDEYGEEWMNKMSFKNVQT